MSAGDRTRTRARSVAMATVGVIAIGVGLFLLLDAESVHFVAANSDGATVVLEGQSMQGGSPVLSGWALPLDSFFTVEVPFYAGAVFLFGLRHDLVNAVPAVLASIVVLAGTTVAIRPGRGASRIAGGVTVIAVLGLPSPAWSFFFLQGPWHVGTALACLVAFAAANCGRFGWPAVLATIALAAGLLGDVQTLALGVAPVLGGGVLASCRSRSVRRGAPLAAVAVGSVVLAYAVRKLLDAIGTFTLVDANPTARLAQVGANLRHLPDRFAGVLGVGTVPIGPDTTSSRFEAIHVIVLGILLVALAAGLVSLFRGVVFGDERTGVPDGSRTLDDVLLLGVAGDLGAFVLLAATGNGDYARYLTAGIVFAAVLAGRQISRAGAIESRRATALLLGSFVLAGLLATACAVDFGLAPVSRPVDALGAYLESAGLTSGIGDYWSSSIVTTTTDGQVVVRPVITTPAGTLTRYGRQSTSEWYRGKSFTFLVYDTHRPWRSVGERSAIATFGVPKEVLSEGTYRILVFRAPVRVSPVGYSNG